MSFIAQHGWQRGCGKWRRKRRGGCLSLQLKRFLTERNTQLGSLTFQRAWFSAKDVSRTCPRHEFSLSLPTNCCDVLKVLATSYPKSTHTLTQTHRHTHFLVPMTRASVGCLGFLIYWCSGLSKRGPGGWGELADFIPSCLARGCVIQLAMCWFTMDIFEMDASATKSLMSPLTLQLPSSSLPEGFLWPQELFSLGTEQTRGATGTILN